MLEALDLLICLAALIDPAAPAPVPVAPGHRVAVMQGPSFVAAGPSGKLPSSFLKQPPTAISSGTSGPGSGLARGSLFNPAEEPPRAASETLLAQSDTPSKKKKRAADALEHGNDSFRNVTGRKENGQSAAISGFEDHSVSVIGNDQTVTYDDSNVFVSRGGPINANTGDTDSSGLNAVDIVRSRIRSGNSGDGEGGAEGEEADEDAPSEGKKAAKETEEETKENFVGERLLKELERFLKTTEDPSVLPIARTRRNRLVIEDDEDKEDEEDEEDHRKAPRAVRRGEAWGTVTDEGASTATGKNSIVVGADGYDDVSVRSRGDRNVVTYDDSNVVIGGQGKVNAQIGDSDTGGAVVMGVHDSEVEAGCEGDLCASTKPKS